MIVMKVVSAIDGAAAGMILLDIGHVVVGGHFGDMMEKESCVEE
jgi:hypothetical protein